MSPADLRQQCRRQIELVGGRAVVTLIQKGYANHDTSRLLGAKGGPEGRVCGPGPTDGTKVVMYPALDVLAWLDETLPEVVS